MAIAGLNRLLSTFSSRARPRDRAYSPHDAYALWAENYPARPHNPLMEAEQAVVQPMIEAAKPRRALDVGTGTGRYLSILQAAGAEVVVGIDMSMAMLRRATPTLPRVCGNGCRLPFRDSAFDLVCSSLMAGDVAALESWVREAARILEPGGHLVYSDFHPSWTPEGWRRTFRAADGRLCELSFFPHAIEEHLAALERTGLVVRTIREPRLSAAQAPVIVALHAVKRGLRRLAARGETGAAFDRRCIPSGCVAPPSNIPDILGRRALPAGRIAGLDATRQFHHGLLGAHGAPDPGAPNARFVRVGVGMERSGAQGPPGARSSTEPASGAEPHV